MTSILLKAFYILIVCFPALANQLCPKNLIVNYTEWIPYTFRMTDKSIEGFDTRILNEVLTKLDCSYKYVHCPWRRCLENIKNGSATVINGITPNEERSKYAHFSMPYRDEKAVIVTKKGMGKNFKINNLSDISKNKLFLTSFPGSYFGNEFKQFIESASNRNFIILSKSASHEVSLLRLGRVQLIARDLGEIDYHLRKEKLEYEIVHTINETKVTFMFSKKNVSPEFLDSFNRNLEQVIRPNNLGKIVSQMPL